MKRSLSASALFFGPSTDSAGEAECCSRSCEDRREVDDAFNELVAMGRRLGLGSFYLCPSLQSQTFSPHKPRVHKATGAGPPPSAFCPSSRSTSLVSAEGAELQRADSWDEVEGARRAEVSLISLGVFLGGST